MIGMTLAALAIGIAAAVPLAAQNKRPVVPPLSANPTVKEVIARNTAAMGGKEAHAAIRFLHLKQTMSMPGGFSSETETFMARPRVYTRISMPGVGTTESGFDGKVGWSYSPHTGPLLLTGAPLDQLRSVGNPGVDIQENERPMRIGERRTIEGRPTIEIVTSLPSGDEYSFYFDVETGYLVALGQKPKTGNVEEAPLMIFSDYEWFGSFMRARTMTTRVPTGQSLVNRLVLLDTNFIDSARFVPPESVRALVAKSAVARP